MHFRTVPPGVPRQPAVGDGHLLTAGFVGADSTGVIQWGQYLGRSALTSAP
jgi:hypothetical protein